MPAGSAKLGQQPRDRTGNTLSGADLEATKLPSRVGRKHQVPTSIREEPLQPRAPAIAIFS